MSTLTPPVVTWSDATFNNARTLISAISKAARAAQKALKRLPVRFFIATMLRACDTPPRLPVGIGTQDMGIGR